MILFVLLILLAVFVLGEIATVRGTLKGTLNSLVSNA